MRKFIITSELRKLEGQVSLGEISYSKMVELLNEKADKWFSDKIEELNSIEAYGSHHLDAVKISNGKICAECGVCPNVSERVYACSFEDQGAYWMPEDGSGVGIPIVCKECR